MKTTQRFDYGRLAEALQERGLVDPTILRELLHQAQQGIGSFTEALVFSGHVADWDLSRMVCELYQLPFLPVEVLPPHEKALEGLDRDFLHQHALVPMGRFGQVLTVSMPGLVPAGILGMLAAQTDAVVLPMVGTVQTNRAWVDEHLTPEAPDLENDPTWGNLFDDADAAVLMDLKKVQDVDPSAVDDGAAGISEEEAALALEFAQAPPDLEAGPDDGIALPVDSVGVPTPGGGEHLEADDLPGLPPGTEPLDLPPSPDFDL